MDLCYLLCTDLLSGVNDTGKVHIYICVCVCVCVTHMHAHTHTLCFRVVWGFLKFYPLTLTLLSLNLPITENFLNFLIFKK